MFENYFNNILPIEHQPELAGTVIGTMVRGYKAEHAKNILNLDNLDTFEPKYFDS